MLALLALVVKVAENVQTRFTLGVQLLLQRRLFARFAVELIPRLLRLLLRDSNLFVRGELHLAFVFQQLSRLGVRAALLGELRARLFDLLQALFELREQVLTRVRELRL